eukprot:2199996-Pyramimonas_sp.AAC.1
MSAVCIWFFVLFLVVIAGVAAVIHLFVEDVCGVLLEGNAESNGLGIFAVNVEGFDSFTVGDTEIDNLSVYVKPMLTCPIGCTYAAMSNEALANGTIGTSVGCDETNSFGLMLGVEDEFDFTTDISDAVDDIRTNIAELDSTAHINSARSALSEALSLLDLDLLG